MFLKLFSPALGHRYWNGHGVTENPNELADLAEAEALRTARALVREDSTLTVYLKTPGRTEGRRVEGALALKARLARKERDTAARVRATLAQLNTR